MQTFRKTSACAALILLAALIMAPSYDPNGPSCISTCALTSPWETVLELGKSLPGDQFISGLAAYKKDAYAIGSLKKPGVTYAHWTVERSTDAGDTWTSSDTFQYDEAQPTIANDVAIDPRNGHVYVVGSTQNDSPIFPAHAWVVRKSADHGVTWKTVHDQVDGAYVSSITVDQNGIVYAGGGIRQADGVTYKGLIRRSTDGGATWTDIDVSSLVSNVTKIIASEEGNIFAAGVTGSSVPGSWVIIHSATGGSGWSTVDTFSGGLAVRAAASQGKLVVFAGQAIGSGGGFRWVVRRASVDAPTTWTTIDEYQPVNPAAGSGSAVAAAATFARDGNLYVGGHAIIADRTASFFSTRAGNPPAIPFSESDHVPDPAPLVAEISFAFGGAATTSKGDVLVGQMPVADIGGSRAGSYWIIRKLRCK